MLRYRRVNADRWKKFQASALRRADSTVRRQFIFPEARFSPDGGGIGPKPVYAMLRFRPESLSTHPNSHVPMKTRLVLALSLALLAGAHAATITLEMTRDTKYRGTAVVSGSLLPGEFPALDPNSVSVDWSGGYYRYVVLELPKVGINWNVWGIIMQKFYYTAADEYVGTVYDLSLSGQHMVAPDLGEAAKGLPMLVYHDNLEEGPILSNNRPPVRPWDTYPHLAGNHPDTMSLTVADLNGNQPGVVSSTAALFAASVELHHVPDGGSTLLWLGAGCAGAAWLSRSRRYRR